MFGRTQPLHRHLAKVLVAVLAALVGWVGIQILLDGDDTKLSEAEFTDFSGAAFHARLPCTPKMQQQTAKTPDGGSIAISIWLCESGGEAYSVSATDVAGRAVDLVGAANGAAQAVSGTVADLKKTTYDGFPAVDFRVPDAKKGSSRGTVFARVIHANGVLYQLQFVGRGDSATPPAAYGPFLAGFDAT